MLATNADSEAVTTPTTDEALALLTDVHRRRVLVSLLDDDIVDPETTLLGDDCPAVELHHVHLPKLDEADVVDWDRDGGFVHRGDRYESIRPLLELLAENPGHLPPNWL
ncbi:DUF7344 domain-containing protein [Halomarina oriensis]|uniref:ArsR family transcriptional regulator n=1 Tax=Halomarina oriensis TaxID=671145 RepID=A0A6B0GQR0_9EURY|nr:ArsR family transcriptional regulator [Halomarina oriensis]MWG35707.1 ArsR family transcriptional regulator [Halomarina oriensis]